VQYRTTSTDIRDAQTLARDLVQWPQYLGLTDAVNRHVAQSISVAAKHAQPRDATFHLWHGAMGTGKSAATIAKVRELLANGADPARIAFVAWTPMLQDALINEINPLFPQFTKHNFPLGYKPLIMGAEHVFFDDATLFPPGYFQLFLGNCPWTTDLYFTFDCAQAGTVFPEGTAASRRLPRTRQWLAPHSSNYGTLVRRKSRQWCELTGFPADLATTLGEITTCSQPPRDVPYLAASPRFTNVLANGDTTAFAFSEVQGLTWRGDVAIDLGGLTSAITDAQAWMVLGRSTGNDWIVLPKDVAAANRVMDMCYGRSMIFSAIMAVAGYSQSPVVNVNTDPERLVARAVQSHLASCLSPACVRQLGLQAAQPVVAGEIPNREPVFEAMAALRSHPEAASLSVRSLMPGRSRRTKPRRAKAEGTRLEKAAHAVRHYVPITQETRVSAPPSTYQLPEFVPPDEIVFDPVHEHLDWLVEPDAELSHSGHQERTAVYDPIGPKHAQHHGAKDESLLWYSLKRRVAPKPHQRRTLDESGRIRLRQLKAGYAKFMPTEPVPFNDELMDDCVAQALSPWFSGKTAAGIEAAVERWDFSDDPLLYRVFQKGQWIKKLEAKDAPPKKSQIITQVHLNRIFNDAIYAMYFERVKASIRPDTTLVFAERNPQELADWYDEHWKPEIGVTSTDYTGWDTGMDLPFLEFSCWLQRLYGVPSHYVDTYRWERMHSKTFLGPFPIMQASGDRKTFDDNCDRDLAITGAATACPSRTPIIVCGDDVAMPGIHRPERHFRPSAWPLTVKLTQAKRVVCVGYEFGGPRLHASLKALIHHVEIGTQRGSTDPTYWRSFADRLPLVAGSAEEWGTLRHKLRVANSCLSAAAPMF